MKAAILMGGVVAVGGLVYVMFRQGAAGAAGPGADFRCKAGRVIAGLYGAQISDEQCEKLNALDDLVGLGALRSLVGGWGSKDSKNKELNGPVEIELTEQVKGFTGMAKRDVAAASSVNGAAPPPGAGAYLVLPLLNGTVLRFKNGGVPFAEHPDFAKCAAGTHDMTTSFANEVSRFFCKTPGKRPTSAQFQKGGDTLAALIDTRFPPRIRDLLRGSNNDPATHIASSVVAGVPHVCETGVLLEVIPVTDHRESEGRTIIKRCGAPGSTPSAPTPVAGTGTRTVPPPGPNPPGYVWVQANASTPVAHWERAK